MNFFTHKIVNPTGNAKSFDDWVNENVFNKQAETEEAKVASEAKPECDDDPRGQCRGQVINNDNEDGAHSYQEGESVDGKEDQAEGKKSSAGTKEAHCAKEMGECGNAGKVTEDHSDAGNADVGNAEVSQNINNDPNYQKGESTNPGKVKGKTKKQPGDPVVGKSKSSASKKYQKVASMNRQDKVKLFAVLASNKVNPINYVEAMVGITLANMTEDEKNFVRRFWLTMYPRDYVEDMVANR